MKTPSHHPAQTEEDENETENESEKEKKKEKVPVPTHYTTTVHLPNTTPNHPKSNPTTKHDIHVVNLEPPIPSPEPPPAIGPASENENATRVEETGGFLWSRLEWTGASLALAHASVG
ncbi:predicted protein [Plenodomus lingam JN3]|uniref:Predicted protein n=1 Tax=Leptosphaeria maculans (strain JN3 / isolate v23.1.3 / race Av1-4-5-6-7-8) TaxID=985895 RepID=E5A2I8_LEPMJ|nr:predicted protein [Plenodomus lingam JN3]CBX97784.1 predicted protein [Plenodomus lingam JN3]